MTDQPNRSSIQAKVDPWSYECPVCWHSFAPNERPDDGRCDQCEASPVLREKQSEFGAGVVVCLAKFTEHLWTDRDAVIGELVALKAGRLKREGLSRRAESELSMAEDSRFRLHPDALVGAIESAVSMWASGAGDHFYELDRERAPQALVDLADLVLAMRNTHMGSGWRWTDGDWDKLRDLWRDSCLALDRMLGVNPNWGEW